MNDNNMNEAKMQWEAPVLIELAACKDTENSGGTKSDGYTSAKHS